MADVITYQRFWQRRDTAANWTSANPTLASGEIGLEIDTRKFKIGDGSTSWTSLNYYCAVPLSDPGADSLVFWDDSDSTWKHLSLGTGLSITGTTISASGSGGATDVFTEAQESWDFIKQGFTTSANTGTSFLTNGAVPVVYTSGAASGATLTGEAGSPGIVSITTGTATTGRARMFFCPPCIVLSGGEIAYRVRIRIPTLSDGTNRFDVGVWMANAISGAGLQRIGADYSDSINSGQWVANAIDGVGTTSTNTTVAPSANTWMVLELRPNAAGTSWELFIGSSSSALASAGTVSANIPAVSLGLAVSITKSIGITARTVDVDVASFRQTFTTSR